MDKTFLNSDQRTYENDQRTYENIWKIAIRQWDDYTTICLLDYVYLKNSYEGDSNRSK